MTETYRYLAVKRYKRSIGKLCLHCGRPATVVAIRKRESNGMRMPVRFCALHADLIIGGQSGQP
jgi:hypothetical protein